MFVGTRGHGLGEQRSALSADSVLKFLLSLEEF